MLETVHSEDDRNVIVLLILLIIKGDIREWIKPGGKKV